MPPEPVWVDEQEYEVEPGGGGGQLVVVVDGDKVLKKELRVILAHQLYLTKVIQIMSDPP